MKLSDFKKGDRVRYKGYRENYIYGVVSSVNKVCVFVKYDNADRVMKTGNEDYTSQATKPENLELVRSK